jgi:hypothetical protein
MSSQTAIPLMSAAEFAVWLVLAFLFWRKKLSRRFPAMGAYLGLRVVSAPVLFLIRSGDPTLFPSNQWLTAYFVAFWAVYVASAVLLLFICMEVFASALSAFSGLRKLGLLLLRWAILASAIVTFSSISFAHKGILVVPEIAFAVTRSVGVLELFLLAFLCRSMTALRLSVRDISFGIALGFGLVSANDLIAATLLSRNAVLSAPMQVAYESLILVALGTWAAYFALPEPVRTPVLIPVNSTIYRWNEIASALGHTGTQVAVREPATSFLLSDVESVVDRVLTRNLNDRKSEI